MRQSVLLTACLTVALALTGCEASCSYSTAELTDAQVARSIHPDTQAPLEPATTFGPEAGVIYAVAKLSYAPEDTKVGASFHYLEGGDREIASDEIEAGGDIWVSFTLSPPDTGWPAGQYEVRFHLNGERVDRVPFNVTPRTAGAPTQTPTAAESPHSEPPPPRDEPPRTPPREKPVERRTPAAPPSEAESAKIFADEKFGFELEVPKTWSYRVTPEKDYLIEGSKDTEAFELYVLLQFVSKAANPGSSAVDQAQGILEQVMQIPDAKLLTQEMLQMGGQDAPYFVATYTAKNSQRVSTAFGHTQIVLDHGNYFYHVSYFGPVDIYEEYSPIFERIVDTFTFTD